MRNEIKSEPFEIKSPAHQSREAFVVNHPETNFAVIACVQLMRRNPIDLPAIQSLLNVCKRSALSDADKNILFFEAFQQEQFSTEEIKTLFLEPFKISSEIVRASLTHFLHNLKTDYKIRLAIERIRLSLCYQTEMNPPQKDSMSKKDLNREAISDCLRHSHFLTFYVQDNEKNYDRALAMNAFLSGAGLSTFDKKSLHKACAANNIQLALNLIDQGAKVICYDAENKTPLDICIEAGPSHVKLTSILVTQHAAAVMQKIPDLFFNLGISGHIKPIFLGASFDLENPSERFAHPILTLQDLIEQFKTEEEIAQENDNVVTAEKKPPIVGKFFDAVTEELIEVSKGTDLSRLAKRLDGEPWDGDPANQYTQIIRVNERAPELKTGKWHKKIMNAGRQDQLITVAKRLEECIELGIKTQEACVLRKKVRFCLPPNDLLPHYGLKHMLVEKFPITLFSGLSESELAKLQKVYQEIVANNIDIRYSNFELLYKEQIHILNARLEKLQELIDILAPYSKEAKENFNRKASRTLAPSALFLFAAGCIIGAVLTGLKADYSSPQTGWAAAPAIFSPFALMALIGSICLLTLYKGSTTWPTDPNRTKALSTVKNAHPLFITFLQNLPTEAFLDAQEHVAEKNILTQLSAFNGETQAEEIRNALIELKNVYEAHVKELSEANLNQAPRFQYQENAGVPAGNAARIAEPDHRINFQSDAERIEMATDHGEDDDETEALAAALFSETDSLLPRASK